MGTDPVIEKYLLAVGGRETDLQRRLREETMRLPRGRMQAGPETAQILAFLVRLLGARHCLEVGTFTGFSALAVAQALPEGGRLIACDVSEEWTAIGRRYWQEAGVADRIDLRIGPGSATLHRLIAEGRAGQFDFAFIDADKTGYDGYYEDCLILLRPGGVIALDTMLWSGAVADPAINDADTVALRTLNAKIHADPRVDMCLLPIGDGVNLVRKI
ncbi:MAG: class I SAM-dependent methyltransferase [Ferrovibrionaceae bacterium]